MNDVSFEFEAQLDAHNAARLLTQGPDQGRELVHVPPQEVIGQQPGNYKKNYKKTVCQFWLKGMCMKGDQCGFLHQFDVDKMPICRNLLKYGECKELDCPYKHNTEEIKECNMYKLGFCIYGPSCRYKHKPMPGPPPKVESVEAAKPKDFRDVNTVVNYANPGVAGDRDREALASLGMGAGLRRGGGMGGSGRRRFGPDAHQGDGQNKRARATGAAAWEGRDGLQAPAIAEYAQAWGGQPYGSGAEQGEGSVQLFGAGGFPQGVGQIGLEGGMVVPPHYLGMGLPMPHVMQRGQQQHHHHQQQMMGRQ